MTRPQTLVLYPTAMEQRRLEDLGGLQYPGAVSAVCGFGVVAAAARTAQLLSESHAGRVLLVGIAGTFDEGAAPVCSALEFSTVAVDGIGAGEGTGFVNPREMGFPQWRIGDEPGRGEIFDRIQIAAPSTVGALLLTVCAASANEDQVTRRRRRFPSTCAEDMEGFSVAMACALNSVPVRIVRGISNLAGDRDVRNWHVSEALAAARQLAMTVLESW